MKRKRRSHFLWITALIFFIGFGTGSPAQETLAKETAAGENPADERQPDKAQAQGVTITLAGDCSLGKLSIHGYEGTFYEMYDKYGPSYFFKNVKSIFEDDDMTLVNFEGVLTRSNHIVEKQYNIKGEPEFNQILVEAGIDAVSFGNNHRIDYGEEGVTDTIEAFREIHMPYAYDEHVGIYVTNGIRIGFVSVNEVYDGIRVEEYLQQGIIRLKEAGANLILACCHWGIEGDHYPNDYQKELGRKCIDWGADLVVGSHPHVLQGIDYYNGKYIIYSLGNFCFGGNRNPKNKDSMMIRAFFPVTEGAVKGEALLSVIPCTISSVESRNDYCPTVAEEGRRGEIFKKLNRYCRDFPVSVGDDGRVTHH